MPIVRVNGIGIHCEQTGQAGEPLVLVHGSWGDHHNWDLVVPELAKSFRVITYDRRGHSLSERPTTQGSFDEDADDLAALIETLNLAPAHICGNSGGAAIALKLAAKRSDLFRSIIVHEPPLFGLLAGNPDAATPLQEAQRRIGAVLQLLEAGELHEGARLFVETVAFGPGAWEELPAELRQTFVRNAPTFLDESRDPNGLNVDLAALKRFRHPALLSHGTTSAPFFPLVVRRVAEALPHAELVVFADAGHVPHLSNPAKYVQTVTGFIARQMPARPAEHPDERAALM